MRLLWLTLCIRLRFSVSTFIIRSHFDLILSRGISARTARRTERDKPPTTAAGAAKIIPSYSSGSASVHTRASLGPHESAFKRHLDRFSRFAAVSAALSSTPNRQTDRRSQVTERNNRPRRELLAVLAMRATNPHTRGELVGRPPAERGHAPGKLYATSGGGGGGGVLTRAIQLSDCSPQTTACLLHRPHQSIIQQCDFRFDLLLFSSSFSFNLVYFQRSFSF